VKIKICESSVLLVVLYGCEIWSFTLRDVYTFSIFEKRVLMRIFAYNREEVTGGGIKLHSEYLNKCNSSPNIIRVVKARKMG
jgi:hypothetical protein